MNTRILVLSAALALFGIALSGCSDPPQPVDAPKAASSQLPPGHPPTAAPTGAETRLAGTIALEGAAFDAPETTVFVSVRPVGQKAPWLSRKYPMQSAQIVTADGKRTLSFELRSADPAGETTNLNGLNEAPAGIALELCARAFSKGFVESQGLGEVAAPFESGKSDYALTLALQ